MIAREAEIVLALLRHLDASQQLDPTDLIVDIEWLADAAGVALGGALPVDLDVILQTLGEVEQRFSDGCYWDEDAEEFRPIEDGDDLYDDDYEEPARPIETIQVGDRL